MMTGMTCDASSAPPVATPAYDVYSRQLYSHGYGYPLWHPEPQHGHAINIGDVGYLRNGVFVRIFNTTLLGEHHSHADFGVPDQYEPYKVNRLLTSVHQGVLGPSLFSAKVTSKDVESGDPATTLLAPLETKIRVECEQGQGAFVFVDLPADCSRMHPSKSFARYMKTNLEAWDELASRLEFENPNKGLIVITGTVKTNEWVLGAFVKQGEARFTSGINFAKTALSMGGKAEMRTRPRTQEEQEAVLLAAEGGQASETSGPSLGRVRSVHQEKDQTLFFHYYKVKKRDLSSSKEIPSAAGLHGLVYDFSGEGSDSSEDDVVDEPHIDLMYDPVDYLLGYILNYPVEDGIKVQVAIASDTHLYALFNGEIPSDIPAALEITRPPIMFLDEEKTFASLAVAEWSDELDQEDNNSEPYQKELDSSSGDPGAETQPATSLAAATPAAPAVVAPVVPPAVQAGQPVILQDHTGGVTCVAFSPDGRYIASGSEDTVIILRDAADGRVIHKITEHNEAIWTLAFSPDSGRLASGASDGNALVWDLEQSAVVAVLDGHSGVVQTITYSPDGSKLVTSSVDFTVRTWDATTGALLRIMEDHKAVVMTAIFSPDGRWVASCGADYKAKIWDAETGVLKHTLAEHTGVVWSIAFSPDSRKVVTGSDDTTSRIWNAETGDELIILREHNGPVWSVAFSPDGKYVMSASNDATIKICDALTGERIHAFDRHDTVVNAAVFSPDGKYVASSAGDNAVMVWNLENGKNFPPMEGHLDKVTGLQFSPEGDRIASCSDDGTVRIWTLPEAEQDPWLCESGY